VNTRVAALLRSLGPLVGLVAVWLLFALVAGPNFRSLENLRLVLLQTAVVGTAAVGATFVIASGGIDLSVGATIALCTMVVAGLLDAGASGPVAALGGVAAGAAVGTVVGCAVVGRVEVLLGAGLAGLAATLAWPHGGAALAIAALLPTLVASILLGRRFLPRLELSPFIVTLGLWGALRGVAKGLGDNQPIYPDSDALQGLMSRSSAVLGLPAGVWILLGLALVASLVLERTPFGRHVVAVGSSEATARLCGVDVARTKVLVYALGIGCAGLAAVLQYAYVPMGDPTAAAGYELSVIAAVVIGGASLSGGEGSIRGTLVGALLMSVVASGCAKLELSNWVQEIATGAIIVAAVCLDRLRARAA
jgi:ribose/xylose/arabinose/galactoside ABC-type transport system permease subunit